MASVYSNSYLTIAAMAGPDPDYGLFFQRWTLAKVINSILEDQRLLIENIDISCEIYQGAFVRCPASFLSRTQALYGIRQCNESFGRRTTDDRGMGIPRKTTFSTHSAFSCRGTYLGVQASVKCECT